MNEFEVVVTPKSGTIETNFADIKAQLMVEMEKYQGIEVTEDTLPERKKDVAFLRKVKKSINDKKVDIKKLYMKPYTAFEDECKSMMAIVDKPIDELDKQIKTYDEKRIANKKIELEQQYTENIEDYSDFIPFENTLEDGWSNVSYKNKDYLYHLSELKIRVRSDLDCIRGLSSEIEEELISIYQKSGNNLSSAVSRNTQYISDKQRVAEQVKEQVKEEVRKEVEETVKNEEIVLEKPAPIIQFEDLQKKITMVHFVVSLEDAEKVEQFLKFSEIAYRKE